VSPGIVDTAMSRAQPEERRAMAISRTMLKRAARPEEVAAAILWLVETRPHYMSGADLNVSNGLTW
jgi:3-oxoacyl-[acyl-carrier protein] reductase